MKARHLVAMMLWLGGCQCARLEDYKVCDATVDCDPSPDASVAEDAGADAGAADAGLDASVACVPESQPDLLDPAGLDSDCDGVDGVKARQLYVAGAPQGDDSSAEPGNPQRPFATLGAALRFAASADAGRFDAVLVRQGTYPEQAVEWRADVDIWGGRSGAGTWPAVGLSNLVGGSVALVVKDVQGRSLRGFQVHAAAGGPSTASIAVVVEAASPTFLFDELFASAGGDGVAGTSQPVAGAGAGLPGTPGQTGLYEKNLGPAGVCGGDVGWPGGGAGVDGGWGQSGMGPGGGQGAGPVKCFGFTTPEAVAGQDGADGLPGPDGVDGLAFGSLGTDWTWWGTDGTPGGAGQTGKPGSGGGGGGSGAAGTLSSSGGSGGSGGCPGGGGTGGRAGGPSVGLLVRGGRVLLGEGTHVFSGSGGAGGAGAAGLPGFPGGDGGSAGPLQTACANAQTNATGAPGGGGGRGGPGGRGGGGGGGHSFAVLCEADGGFALDGGSLAPGAGGAGGVGVDGGRAGVAGASWGCSP